MAQGLTWILLPGLGGDARLFEPQRALGRLVVPRWIDPRPDEALSSYAARLAHAIRRDHALDGPYALGGVSFGGVVAQEMARVLDPQAVALIASCRSSDALAPAVRWFRAGVELVPRPLARWGVEQARTAIAARSAAFPFPRRLVAEMADSVSSEFIRWATGAIVRWPGTQLRGRRVRQIHGSRDTIIPADRVWPDEWVPGGEHLINLTHPDQVNRFLQATADAR